MKKSTFLIVGRHAVTEALKNPRRKVHRLFITEDALRKLNRNNQEMNILKKVHVFYKTKNNIPLINIIYANATRNLIGKYTKKRVKHYKIYE